MKKCSTFLFVKRWIDCTLNLNISWYLVVLLFLCVLESKMLTTHFIFLIPTFVADPSFENTMSLDTFFECTEIIKYISTLIDVLCIDYHYIDLIKMHFGTASSISTNTPCNCFCSALCRLLFSQTQIFFPSVASTSLSQIFMWLIKFMPLQLLQLCTSLRLHFFSTHSGILSDFVQQCICNNF